MIVYKITNLVNGSLYVGMTTQPLAVRWSQHVSHAKRHAYPLSRAIVKYGRDAFKVEEIARAETTAELEAAERRYIAELESAVHKRGYNVALGGRGVFGMVRSPEFKARLRAINLGKKLTPEARARMSATRKARGLSPEHLAKMMAGASSPEARAKMGWRLGKPMDEALRMKISESLRRIGYRSPAGVAASAAKAAARMAVECGEDHRKGANAYIDPRGRLHCRACNARAQRRRPLRAKVAA